MTMKKQLILLGIIISFSFIMANGQAPADKHLCKPCESLKDLNIPDVQILQADSRQSDTIKATEIVPELIVHVPFCHVIGLIGKEIEFDLYLPQKWNGRFLMSGNGVFAGSFQHFLTPQVNHGFALVATNTGHNADALIADWALNNMERQLNFGHLAVHRTAMVSKFLIKQAYCSEISYSYFVGCSRGGGQAMMEAQRYPDDFNGIVCGAPAFKWPGLAAQGIRECQTNYPDPKDGADPVISSDNLKLLGEIVNSQWDKLDGVGDGIINEPNLYKIDFDKLPRCENEVPAKTCFTNKQLTAIRTIYEPLVVNDIQIYPGYPVGLEAEPFGLDIWIAGTNPAIKPSLHRTASVAIFKYLIFNNPSWDYTKYDFKNFFQDTKYASSYLDASQADYSGFKKQHGKMIMYHGWNDQAISAFSTIEHYEEAKEVDNDLTDYIRLFLLPGVLHCGSGKGADDVDWVKLIQDWVENNHAPDRVILSKKDNGKTVMTRPVYPYPKVAVYSGKGDSKDEKNFILKENKN